MSLPAPQSEPPRPTGILFPGADRSTGYSGNTLSRQSETRDETSLQRALADKAARLCLFDGDRPLVRIGEPGPDALFDFRHAEALALNRESLVLLGHDDGAPRLAGQVAANNGADDTADGPALIPLPADIKAIDLRSLAMQELLPPATMGLLAQARSILGWHSNHRFCARCGNQTRMELGGVRRRCTACNTQHFPRVDPVVIMLVIDGNNCLLGRSHNFDEGRYSALAGFVEPGETLENAVRRETFEEAGIKVGDVAYFTSQPWPFVSTLMIGCHAGALSRDIVVDTDELDDCRWFSRAETRQILAENHPQGITAPPKMAIAYRLLTAFAEAR